MAALEIKSSFADWVCEYLDATKCLLRDAIEYDLDAEEDIEYLFRVANCNEMKDARVVIKNSYDDYLTSLASQQDDDDDNDFDLLGMINPNFKNFMPVCQRFTQAKEIFYTSRYEKHFESGVNDKLGFNKLVTFTPPQAVDKFGQFAKKVTDDIQRYQKGEEDDYISDGDDFADYLLQIIKLSRVAVSYICICNIALIRYKTRNFDGCEELMGRLMDVPEVREFLEFNYDPEEGEV
ncbi:hypothetical protein H4219_006131 [Mycoemilia scoparia]|uniref:Uncharacterized protein n=1 Tax=Mycoemilia scoparia TaxID=417184 RepID=A0A9W8DNI2_9FUNG|nr:hypothetical protein H4219_006131 [Mycoemilia scoparia]